MHDSRACICRVPGLANESFRCYETQHLPEKQLNTYLFLSGKWAFLSALFAGPGREQYCGLRHEDLRGRLRRSNTL